MGYNISQKQGKNSGGEKVDCQDSKKNGENMCGCCRRTKKRPDEEYRSLINRLSRIEGQVRGIRNMVENNAYCPDILIQTSAVNCALNSFCKELLASHIKTCVVNDIQNGKAETVDELVNMLRKLMK